VPTYRKPVGRHTDNQGMVNQNVKKKTTFKSNYSSNSATFHKSPLIAIMTGLQRNTIVCNIGNRKIQCLLDTGAEISCTSQSFLNNSTLKGSNVQ
jgi:hypothetical protein